MNVEKSKPAAVATAAASPQRLPQIVGHGGTAAVHLTLGIGDYDHTRDLTSGAVRAEGMAITPLVYPVPEEIFFRFTKNLEWDVSEMSLAKFVSLASTGASPMVGIPVFPSRVFRHSAIYVRSDRGIKTPADLKGRTVGIPEWAQTAGLYVRGILVDDYGVDLGSIRWLQAGVNEPGRAEKVELNLPASIRYEPRADTSLSAMLASGEVDAVMSARVPNSFLEGRPNIVRLFPDFQGEELASYKRTGIYPIMHLIAMRRAVFEQHPWIAMNLYKAFEEAKRRSIARMRDITVSHYPYPWLVTVAAQAEEAFGPDLFPYGLAANRPTLEAFCRYAHEQGVTHRRVTPDELFPREVHASVKT